LQVERQPPDGPSAPFLGDKSLRQEGAKPAEAPGHPRGGHARRPTPSRRWHFASQTLVRARGPQSGADRQDPAARPYRKAGKHPLLAKLAAPTTPARITPEGAGKAGARTHCRRWLARKRESGQRSSGVKARWNMYWLKLVKGTCAFFCYGRSQRTSVKKEKAAEEGGRRA
jgi:hypothetical protein